jgi:superfamily II DNA or RNA helicase
MHVNFSLRPYQRAGVDALRAAYRDRCRAPLYALPTGGGKTLVFSYITKGAVERGKRVLILVHRAELLRQASRSLTAWGVPHGCIVAGAPGMTGHHVQVASVQTVVRRLQRIAPPDLVIVDEAHHAVAGTWQKIIEAFPNARLLGVTATPERLDGKGLGVRSGGYFDRLIEGPSMQELIDGGFLAQPRVFVAEVNPDMTGVRTTAGDFNRGEMDEAVRDTRVVGDAVAHYRRICPGVPAIAFCVSLAHADAVVDAFRRGGFRARRIDGAMSDVDRMSVVSDLAEGRLDVMVSVDLVSEGFDVPVCGAALLLRPTQSESLFLQQVGRALRPAPGKPHAFILDHAENTTRHGLPQDERDWTLDGRKRRDEPPGVRVCPSCFAASASGSRVCTNCGAAFPVAETRKREIDEVAGELIELTPEMIAERRLARSREIGLARTEAELRALAERRGYKPGWVFRMMRARAGRANGGAA